MTHGHHTLTGPQIPRVTHSYWRELRQLATGLLDLQHGDVDVVVLAE
jgi:hypothetical protein